MRTDVVVDEEFLRCNERPALCCIAGVSFQLAVEAAILQLLRREGSGTWRGLLRRILGQQLRQDGG